jgi:hypothetical protein
MAVAIPGALLVVHLLAAELWPAGVDTEALFAETRHAVHELGVYRAVVSKTERVRGRVVGPQAAEVLIRERPRALRMTFLDERGRPGRRLVYNELVRPSQMRVRESGLLGHVAAVWVDIDGWLAHRASNHSVRDVGFGPLLDIIDRDRTAARPYGGHRRQDEPSGSGPGGTSCVVFLAPPAARGLYATRTRLCFDARLHLPLLIEVWDGGGFLERYLWQSVAPHQVVSEQLFSPAAL